MVVLINSHIPPNHLHTPKLLYTIAVAMRTEQRELRILYLVLGQAFQSLQQSPHIRALFTSFVSQVDLPGSNEEPGPVNYCSSRAEPLPRTGGTAAEVGLPG